MIKYRQILCSLFLLSDSFFQFALAQNIPNSPNFIDDSVQVDPLISLRSLATGGILVNGQYTDERNLTWTIREVLPEKTFFQNTSGITQFQTPGLPRCLYTINNRIITANCDPLDAGSLWQLIPSTKGGVQIQSMRSQQCLSAGDRYTDFRLTDCQTDPNQIVSPKLLWILAPAANQATLSPDFAQ